MGDSTYVVFELNPMAGPVRLVLAVLAAVGRGAVAVGANVFCCPIPNEGKAAGLEAAIDAPNPNEPVAPNAGAGANVGAGAGAEAGTNDGGAVVAAAAAAGVAPNANDDVVLVAGAPNPPSDGTPAADDGVAPVNSRSN